ncbi:MAG: hypothetical protein ACE5LC_04620 [Candidatus Aminicenantales bacterium]
MNAYTAIAAENEFLIFETTQLLPDTSHLYSMPWIIQMIAWM